MIGRWLIAGVLALVGVLRVEAHQELYHNLEVDLVATAETGRVTLSFTVHAPELLVGFEEAADAMFNERWLAQLSDEQLGRVIELARVYLSERFTLRIDAGEAVKPGEQVAFEDYETMRRSVGRDLPPACIRATLDLALPPGARELQVEHAADSEKRLMLVVCRPKAFPAVFDVEPGSRAAVTLLDAPPGPDPRPENARARFLMIAVAGGGVLSGLLLAWWWGRRARGKA